MNRPNRYIGRSALEKERTDFEDLRRFYCDKDWMLDRIDEWEQDMKEISSMAPYAAFQYLLKKIGYQDFLKEQVNKLQTEETDFLEIVDELAQSMKRRKTMKEWLDFSQIYTDKLRQMEKKRSLQRKGRILTMHGAKGLEYRCVYIIEALEEQFPTEKRWQTKRSKKREDSFM